MGVGGRGEASPHKFVVRVPQSTETKRKSVDVHDDSEKSLSKLSESPERTSALSDDFSQSQSFSSGSFSSSSRKRSYKDNPSYDPKWKKKYPWMDYYSRGTYVLHSL